MKKLIFILPLFFLLWHCGSEDDICTEAEGSPRMKVAFKTLLTGKKKKIDTLFVKVELPVASNSWTTFSKVDSVFVPLRVDNQNFTRFWIKTSAKGDSSLIQTNYQITKKYVSPACGYKALYENTSSTLSGIGPVKKIESASTSIENEQTTHLYLFF